MLIVFGYMINNKPITNVLPERPSDLKMGYFLRLLFTRQYYSKDILQDLCIIPFLSMFTSINLSIYVRIYIYRHIRVRLGSQEGYDPGPLKI